MIESSTMRDHQNIATRANAIQLWQPVLTTFPQSNDSLSLGRVRVSPAVVLSSLHFNIDRIRILWLCNPWPFNFACATAYVLSDHGRSSNLNQMLEGK